MSSFKTRALDSLRSRRTTATAKSAFVGLDGFVDTIVTPVAQRTARGEAFTPISTIPEFAARLGAAGGKSTNIELYPRLDKLGGNGPIMAAALLATGIRTTCVGTLGLPDLHPAFAEFATRARVISLAPPASTLALEFHDGKLMLGQLKPLDAITLPAIEAAMGADAFRSALASSDLVALVNWTMIPGMSAIFAALVEEILPSLPPRPPQASPRAFFFDLADPEKRTPSDLHAALHLIARFGAFGTVTLGLNLKEAQQVAAVLNLAAPDKDEASLRAAAAAIRAKLDVATVVVHPRESAACATAAGTAWVPGPYTDQPLITTGAGDHFNAGFTRSQLIGLDPEASLTLGVCTSGHYVRTGLSPSLDDLETFLANWT